MMQAELTQRNLAQVGEEITHELGAQMISDFQTANPAEGKGYQLGRNIIEQILNQPGCEAIRFYNAYNELGEKTLVYVGVDCFNKAICEYTLINTDGSFDSKLAIVADRIGRPPAGGVDTPGVHDADWWEEVLNA